MIELYYRGELLFGGGLIVRFLSRLIVVIDAGRNSLFILTFFQYLNDVTGVNREPPKRFSFRYDVAHRIYTLGESGKSFGSSKRTLYHAGFQSFWMRIFSFHKVNICLRAYWDQPRMTRLLILDKPRSVIAMGMSIFSRKMSFASAKSSSLLFIRFPPTNLPSIKWQHRAACAIGSSS